MPSAKTDTIKVRDLLAMLDSQGRQCALSGRQLTPETLSADHRIPIASGGAHAIDNVWLVDQEVNVAKGTMSCEAFIQLCRDVVAWQDRGR